MLGAIVVGENPEMVGAWASAVEATAIPVESSSAARTNERGRIEDMELRLVRGDYAPKSS
jgi:hypothetical protein